MKISYGGIVLTTKFASNR